MLALKSVLGERERKHWTPDSHTFSVYPVLFPGHMCGGFARKADSKAHMLKHGGGAACPDYNRESLGKKMLVGSNESFTALHKREMKRRVKGIEGVRDRSWTGRRGRCDSDIRRENYLCEGETHVVDRMGITRRPESLICCEAEIPRGQESQVRFDTGMENECVPQVVWCEPPAPKRWECVSRKNEDGILKRQESPRRAEDNPSVTWEPQYTNKAATPPPAAWPPQEETPAGTHTAPSEASLGQQGEGEYPVERKSRKKRGGSEDRERESKAEPPL